MSKREDIEMMNRISEKCPTEISYRKNLVAIELLDTFFTLFNLNNRMRVLSLLNCCILIQHSCKYGRVFQKSVQLMPRKLKFRKNTG